MAQIITSQLKKVSQYTSHLYCSTPPICIAELLVPLGSKEREIVSVLLPFVSQYASHLYRSTPPICIAIRLPFVSQYFWENLGGCGRRDVPHSQELCAQPDLHPLPHQADEAETLSLSSHKRLLLKTLSSSRVTRGKTVMNSSQNWTGSNHIFSSSKMP